MSASLLALALVASANVAVFAADADEDARAAGESVTPVEDSANGIRTLSDEEIAYALTHLRPLKADAVALRIPDAEIPLAAASRTWSVTNLIVALLSAVVSASLLVLFVAERGTREKSACDASELGQRFDRYMNGENLILKLFAVFMGFGALATFVLTEGLRGSLVVFDEWTWVTVMIFVAQIGALLPMFIARGRRDET